MVTSLLQHGPDWTLFAATFMAIFLAELPDKTSLAILLLAMRHHASAVFIGVALAFVVQNCIAVLLGSALGFLPSQVVQMGSGVLFIAFAFYLWFKRYPKDEKSSLASKIHYVKSVWKSFLFIFIAEWGDLTQLITAALVAKSHRPITVFLAATLALFTTTALAVMIGRQAKKFIQPQILQNIAAIVFGVIGILLLAGFGNK